MNFFFLLAQATQDGAAPGQPQTDAAANAAQAATENADQASEAAPVVEKAVTAVTKTVEDVVAPAEQMATQGMEWLQTYGPKVLGALIFFFAAWVVSGWVARLALRGLSKAKLDMTLTKFLSTTVRWSILAVAAVAGLGIFGVQTASFTAVIGSAGLAIGLAMQGSLSNLAAGVMLLLFRPFRVGDTISVAGQLGKVDEIELFSTRLDTPDNRRIIIPNGQVFGAIIDNHTHHDTRATGINVVVDGKHDIEATRQMLLAAASTVPGRLNDPAPAVGLVKLVPGGVEWSVGLWTKTSDLASVQQELAKAVKHVMDREALGPAAPVTMLQLPKGVEVSYAK